MRFLHVSDLHIDVGLPFLPLASLRGKRFVGWANLRLRRAKYYADAVPKVAALGRLIERERVDAVLCSGDYTALGTIDEIAQARATIEPLTTAKGGLVTVPGNHDVYLEDALGTFERFFGEFLESDLRDLCVDGPWPLVRLYEEVAIVCINSARPNPPVLRSSGRVPDAQLEALGRVLAHPEVKRRFVFVMTHYAPRLSSGKPDTPSHGLENADALLRTCAQIPYGAFLHGHVHKCFTLNVPECAIPLFGAGSTTQMVHEGLWVFDVTRDEARAFRGRYEGGEYRIAETAERVWPASATR